MGAKEEPDTGGPALAMGPKEPATLSLEKPKTDGTDCCLQTRQEGDTPSFVLKKPYKARTVLAES